jgi:hypothetical protein
MCGCGAGLVIQENGLESKRRQIEQRHGGSEATFLLGFFYEQGGFPKTILLLL